MWMARLARGARCGAGGFPPAGSEPGPSALSNQARAMEPNPVAVSVRNCRRPGREVNGTMNWPGRGMASSAEVQEFTGVQQDPGEVAQTVFADQVPGFQEFLVGRRPP